MRQPPGRRVGTTQFSNRLQLTTQQIKEPCNKSKIRLHARRPGQLFDTHSPPLGAPPRLWGRGRETGTLCLRPQTSRLGTPRRRGLRPHAHVRDSLRFTTEVPGLPRSQLERDRPPRGRGPQPLGPPMGTAIPHLTRLAGAQWGFSFLHFFDCLH
jgi:hypothetical protein